MACAEGARATDMDGVHCQELGKAAGVGQCKEAPGLAPALLPERNLFRILVQPVVRSQRPADGDVMRAVHAVAQRSCGAGAGGQTPGG